MDGVFLFVLAGACLAGAAAEGIGVLLNRGRTKETEATVVDVWTTAPPGSRFASKWARVHYTAEGQGYTSAKRIQVPMAFVIGSSLRVRYRTDAPEKLCRWSFKRAVMLLALSAGCWAVGLLL